MFSKITNPAIKLKRKQQHSSIAFILYTFLQLKTPN